jgi:hypothetical protein
MLVLAAIIQRGIGRYFFVTVFYQGERVRRIAPVLDGITIMKDPVIGIDRVGNEFIPRAFQGVPDIVEQAATAQNSIMLIVIKRITGYGQLLMVTAVEGYGIGNIRKIIVGDLRVILDVIIRNDLFVKFGKIILNV